MFCLLMSCFQVLSALIAAPEKIVQRLDQGVKVRISEFQGNAAIVVASVGFPNVFKQMHVGGLLPLPGHQIQHKYEHR